MTVRAEVERLLDRLGWTTAQEIGSLSPVHRSVVVSLATLVRLGYPCGGDYLAEHAVASAVLYEPLPAALRRWAQEEEPARRFGF